MKKLPRRIFAAAMVLAMILVCALPSFAAGTVKSKRHFDNYVIIGDSIAAGYGLNGMIKDFPYTPDNQMTWAGDTVVEGSYPQIVSDAIGAKKVTKLAREAYIAPNILRLIDPEYDAELCKPENYYERFVSECTYMIANPIEPAETERLKVVAVDAISTADVITINLGNNDTFTCALMDPIYRSLYYSYGMAAQPAMTALRGNYVAPKSVDQLISMVGSYKDLFTKLDENTKKFEKNYDRMIKRIRELNPDCEIYVIGMYNLFAQAEPQGGMIQSLLEEENEKLSNELKDYFTVRSKYKKEIYYVDVYNTKVWDNFPLYTPLYYMCIMMGSHPDFEGHQYMANQIIKTMNKHA